MKQNNNEYTALRLTELTERCNEAVLRKPKKWPADQEFVPYIPSTGEVDIDKEIITTLTDVDCDWLQRTPSAGYVINANKFVFIDEYGGQTTRPVFRVMTPKQFILFLSVHLSKYSWHLPETLLIDLFIGQGKAYEFLSYTTNFSEWDGDRVYMPVSHMRAYCHDNKIEYKAEYALSNNFAVENKLRIVNNNVI